MVVAPLATLPNWVREFEKWLPQYPVIRYHGSAPEREAMMRGPMNPKNKRNADFPFIVTSYELSIRDQAKLEKLSKFTYLIVDEGMYACVVLVRSRVTRFTNSSLLLTYLLLQATDSRIIAALS